MGDSVVGLLQVNGSQESWVGVLCVKGTVDLLNVSSNPSLWDEASLLWANDVVKDGREPFVVSLREESLISVDEGDGALVGEEGVVAFLVRKVDVNLLDG
jgi:hypothetical protein